MSIEAHPSGPLSAVPSLTEEKTHSPLKIPEFIIKRWIERMTDKVSVKYPADFKKNYQEAIQEGYFPILVANHDSLFGGLTFSKPASDLTLLANSILPDELKTKGFLMPLATTVTNGGRGGDVQQFYDISNPILEKRHVTPIHLTRAKDVLGGEKPNLLEFTRDMRRRIENGYRGIVVFPEGTVNSGRKDESGKRNGMQLLQFGSISFMSEIAGIRKGQKIMIVPIGMIGDVDVFDPSKNQPSLKALLAGFGMPIPMVNVNVGNITRSTDPEISEFFADVKNDDNKRALDDLFGRKIARLLPQKMQGVYA